MKFHLTVLTSLLIAVTAIAQTSSHQSTSTPTPTTGPKIKVDLTGKFSGQRYVNEGLGLEVTLPDGWQFQDDEVNQKFAEKASERGATMSGGSKAMETSMSHSKILFLAVKPTDSRTNPTILGMAEDVSLAFNVRSPRQYLEIMRLQPFENNPLVFGDRITDEVINNVQFAFLGASARDPMVMAQFNLRQKYYVTLRKHYAIGLVLTYHSPDELESLMEVIRSVKFN